MSKKNIGILLLALNILPILYIYQEHKNSIHIFSELQFIIGVVFVLSVMLFGLGYYILVKSGRRTYYFLMTVVSPLFITLVTYGSITKRYGYEGFFKLLLVYVLLAVSYQTVALYFLFYESKIRQYVS